MRLVFEQPFKCPPNYANRVRIFALKNGQTKTIVNFFYQNYGKKETCWFKESFSTVRDLNQYTPIKIKAE